MLELAMAAGLAGEAPAVFVQPSQEVSYLHLAKLADGVLGHAGLAAVGGFAEVEAGGAVLGVGLELVGDVRRGRVDDVAAVELDRAGAVGAAELGVEVNDRLGDRFELPEGLVASAGF